MLLNFPFTRATRHAANNSAPQEKQTRTETHPTQSPIASVVEIPKARTPDILPPYPPRPEAGVSLKVPGLAPILLAGRNSAPWEKTIDAVIERTDLSDAVKARSLIQMLPGLPAEVLARAAEEAATRLSDADYTNVLRPTLANPQTHGMAMSVLFADLMQRPGSIALPILASIAQDPKHPYSQNARENLQFLLRQDFGSDWAKWNEAIRNRIGSSKP